MAELKPDAVLSGAVDLARESLVGVAEDAALGEHIGFVMDEERLGTHFFTCLAPGYVGWSWAVTVARAPRQRVATVCETELVPGPDALLSPAWVPYQKRLKPGDLGPGDATPYDAEDPNLEQGFEATGEEDVDQVALFELGLGRKRVLSREGRETAAQRWFDAGNGPTNANAVKAPAPCLTCGYLVPMPGVLRQSFGVCANEWSPADGAVVALTFGCGAHSEVDAEAPEPLHVDPPVLDEYAVELHDSADFHVAPEVAAEGAAAPEATQPEEIPQDTETPQDTDTTEDAMTADTTLPQPDENPTAQDVSPVPPTVEGAPGESASVEETAVPEGGTDAGDAATAADEVAEPETTEE